MEVSTNAIRNKLVNELPGSVVLYAYENDTHKFRIQGGTHTHWLSVSRELVADNETVILVNLINIYNIVSALKIATESKRLLDRFCELAYDLRRILSPRLGHLVRTIKS